MSMPGLEISSGVVKELECAQTTKGGITPKEPAELNQFAKTKNALATSNYADGMLIAIGLGLCLVPPPGCFVGIALLLYASIHTTYVTARAAANAKEQDQQQIIDDAMTHYYSGMVFILEVPLYLLLKSAVDHSLIENQSIKEFVTFMGQHHLDGIEPAAPPPVNPECANLASTKELHM